MWRSGIPMALPKRLGALTVVAAALVLTVVGFRPGALPAAAAPDPATGPLRVLLVTAAADYYHESIPTAQGVIGQLAADSGASPLTLLASTADLPRFTAGLLAQHDVVVFANTTGDLPLDERQKRALLDFVRNGGGFVGVHSASATFAMWPEYAGMLGAVFKEHPWIQEGRILVEDTDAPSTRHLAPHFALTEEFYTFQDSPRTHAHVLLTLDATSVNTSGDFPLAWQRQEGAGRVFYTALGHFDSTWNDTGFQRHLLGGIQWAAGRTTQASLPAPQPRGPANGTVLPAVGPVTLRWDVPSGATQHHLRVTPHGNDGPGVNLIIGDPTVVASGAATLQAPVFGQGAYLLLPDMTYTWQVRVTDAPAALSENSPEWGPWSAPSTFRTAVRDCSCIHLAEPADGTTMADVPTLLRWENADTDVFYYEVQVSTDPAFETDPAKATAAVWWNLVHGGTTTPRNSWRTPKLTPGLVYYWRVRPRVQGDGAPVAWPRASNFRAVRVETVAQGLAHPWSLAFAPDGRLFFTQRPNALRVLVPRNGDFALQLEPVLRLSVHQIDEGGMRGLALDPDFARNGWLYLYYSYSPGEGEIRNRLSRFTEQNGRASDERVLLDNVPGGVFHNAGRLDVGPDGKLYVTTGDTANASLPQDATSLAGKVLRLDRDGSVPDDNPFPGSPVYSIGHRNAQGQAWHPVTGKLFVTEHGPSTNVEADACCHDEVNLIQAGGNYGWPLVAGASSDPRFVAPLVESGTDTWAPSGAAFLNAPAMSAWHGNLFFTTLRGMHLHRVILRGPDSGAVETHERWFQGQYGRLRAVTQGPDGMLYFSTSNGGSDRILRFAPDGR